MPATYEKIATTTLGSAASSITFSSIAASWTDLKLVLVSTASVNGVGLNLQFNSDTATNYSLTRLGGDGASAYSNRSTSINSIRLASNGNSSTIPNLYNIDVFSYAGSTYKTTLSTASEDINGSGTVSNVVGLWRSTAAITRIDLSPSSGNFNTGTTATLYGILKA